MSITNFFPKPEPKFKDFHTKHLCIRAHNSYVTLIIYKVQRSSYGYNRKTLILATEGVSHNEMTFDFILSNVSKCYDVKSYDMTLEINELLNKFNSSLK